MQSAGSRGKGQIGVTFANVLVNWLIVHGITVIIVLNTDGKRNMQ